MNHCQSGFVLFWDLRAIVEYSPVIPVSNGVLESTFFRQLALSMTTASKVLRVSLDMGCLILKKPVL